MSEDASPPMIFQTLKSALGAGSARLGRLALPKRQPIETPNFLASTSRGVVPHLTPDNVAAHTAIQGAYMALEDFIERTPAPILSTPSTSQNPRPLHAFTSTPSDVTTVLAARRTPCVTAPLGNSGNAISVFTSTGFRDLPTGEYADLLRQLRPDVAIALADLPLTTSTPQSKRVVRMVERTDEWLGDLLRDVVPDHSEIEERNSKDADNEVAVFAPILPVPYPLQWEYLEHLQNDFRPKLSGLALYDVDLIADLVDNYAPLLDLPRLSLDVAKSPHQILRHISLGMDLFLVPFLNTASDAGIAFTFTFPPLSSPPSRSSIRPLGIDMASPDHRTVLEPLMDLCSCYACTHHHRAFVYHLLDTKEMLGWVLLQMHNHHVVSSFFANVRKTLAEDPMHFEKYCKAFAATYELELPVGTGERPRARGYHFKSEASAMKINTPARWDINAREEEIARRLKGDKVDSVAVTPPDAGKNEDVMVTPLVPDIDSLKLGAAKLAEREERKGNDRA